jgi:hypothetical protein
MVQSGSNGLGSQDLEHAICSPRASKRQQMMETGQLLCEFLAEKPLEASESKPRARTEYADEGAVIVAWGPRLKAKLG